MVSRKSNKVAMTGLVNILTDKLQELHPNTDRDAVKEMAQTIITYFLSVLREGLKIGYIFAIPGVGVLSTRKKPPIRRFNLQSSGFKVTPPRTNLRVRAVAPFLAYLND